MSKQREILPAIMPQSDEELRDGIRSVMRFAPALQIDVMDGMFASSMSWPYRDGQWAELEEYANAHSSLPHAKDVFLEVHLMVEDPEEIGTLFARAGAKRIIGNIATLGNQNDVRRALNTWRLMGAEAGVSILLTTPLEALDPIIDDVDMVQCMSIENIGYQGESFQEVVFDRIKELRKKRPELPISVDGGVSKDNAEELIHAGATRLAIGSAIIKQRDPEDAYNELRAHIMNL